MPRTATECQPSTTRIFADHFWTRSDQWQGHFSAQPRQREVGLIRFDGQVGGDRWGAVDSVTTPSPCRRQPNGAYPIGTYLYQDARAPDPEVKWIWTHERLMPIRVPPDDVGRRSVITTDFNDGTDDLTTPSPPPLPYKLITNVRPHGSRSPRSGPSRSSCGCLPLDDQSPKYLCPICGEGIPQSRLDLGNRGAGPMHRTKCPGCDWLSACQTVTPRPTPRNSLESQVETGC